MSEFETKLVEVLGEIKNELEAISASLDSIEEWCWAEEDEGCESGPVQ